MARGGRFTFDIDFNAFRRRLAVVVTNVERGTRKATVAACEDILAASLMEVPRETNTLASSAYYEVWKSGHNFEAIIGYGGNGDPINPKSGEKASKYMVVVHEDLDAYHPTGKAKFLEDPVRRYHSRMRGRAANILRFELGR